MARFISRGDTKSYRVDWIHVNCVIDSEDYTSSTTTTSSSIHFYSTECDGNKLLFKGVGHRKLLCLLNQSRKSDKIVVNLYNTERDLAVTHGFTSHRTRAAVHFGNVRKNKNHPKIPRDLYSTVWWLNRIL